MYVLLATDIQISKYLAKLDQHPEITHESARLRMRKVFEVGEYSLSSPNMLGSCLLHKTEPG